MSPPAAGSPRSARALAFAVAAAAAAILSAALAVRTVSLVRDAWSMQAWPTVDGTLRSVALEIGARRGSARAVATYTYEAGGQTRTGSRVSLYNGDSIGSFQQRTADDLRGRLDRHEGVPVHVDPADPSRSVLVPVLRPEIVALDVAAVLFFAAVAVVALRLRRRPVAPGAAGTDDDTASVDADAAFEEKASPRLAWRRRLIAIAVVLAAIDYALVDTTIGTRSSTLLERWLADEVVATGEVRAASLPAERLEAAVVSAAAAVHVPPVVTRVEAARGAALRVQVVVPRSEEAQAGPRLASLLDAVPAAFGASPPADLLTSPPTSVLPYRSAAVVSRARGIAWGLLAVAVALAGAGAWL